MSIVKELHDLFSQLHREVKDRHVHAALEPIRSLIYEITEENQRLIVTIADHRTEIAKLNAKIIELGLDHRLSTVDVQIENKLLKAEREFIRLKTESTSPPLVLEQRNVAENEDKQVNLAVTPEELLLTSIAAKPQSSQIEKTLDPQIINPPSTSSLIENVDADEAIAHQRLRQRRELAAIHRILGDSQQRTLPKHDAQSAIIGVIGNEPIDAEIELRELTSSGLLRNTFGRNYELTPAALKLIGE